MGLIRRISVWLLVAFLGAGLLASGSPASGQPADRVEVIQVNGVIDANVERAMVATLALAQDQEAEAVVMQIDSPGGLDAARARRLVEAVLGARVPVITWVGPPGARAEHSAAVLALAGHVVAMAPGTRLGPLETLDLRTREPQSEEAALLARDVLQTRGLDPAGVVDLFAAGRSADHAEDAGLVSVTALQLPDLLRRVDGTLIEVAGAGHTLRTSPAEVSMRLRKVDLWGRVLHAVAQPAIAYLLLLLGLVGLVFELFHPSNGPAGATGLFGLGLGLYGVAVLGGSWFGVALIVAGVAGFCVDLRLNSLGVFTLAGVVGLVAGSVLLFPGPYLTTSPWMLAFGTGGMTMFLLGAMTRVLRDLRAIARGELEVQDPHPH